MWNLCAKPTWDLFWRESRFLSDGKGHPGVEDPLVGVREGQWTLQGLLQSLHHLPQDQDAQRQPPPEWPRRSLFSVPQQSQFTAGQSWTHFKTNSILNYHHSVLAFMKSWAFVFQCCFFLWSPGTNSDLLSIHDLCLQLCKPFRDCGARRSAAEQHRHDGHQFTCGVR